MGIIYNRFILDPRPAPVPTWEQVKSNVKATNAFDYSGYNYTEYLILVYATISNIVYSYEFFFIPEFGTLSQISGHTSVTVTCLPQSNSTIKFSVISNGTTGTSTQTGNYKYTIFGRNKAAWSLVSDNSAIPNYTELVTANGYYTPFNYQVSDCRTAGGTSASYSGTTLRSVSYRGNYREQIYNNAYTHNLGDAVVYTRLFSNESAWTQIHLTNTNTISIADISYSEMFIVGRRLYFDALNNFQTLYVIPEIVKGRYSSGGYSSYNQSNHTYSGSYGFINISDTQVNASYTFLSKGTSTNYFQSLDIYYR